MERHTTSIDLRELDELSRQILRNHEFTAADDGTGTATAVAIHAGRLTLDEELKRLLPAETPQPLSASNPAA